MHKVTTFGEIHVKFVRNSYQFHVNLSEFLRFHALLPFLHMKHPMLCSCLRARVQECNLPTSPGFCVPFVNGGYVAV